MNFYKRYVGDIQRDTGHLSLAEFGAYDRLLDHYYATEMALPSDIDACCRISRAMTKDERKAVISILNQYFKLNERGYEQKRAEKEITEAQPAMVSARLNGSKGGRPKKQQNETQQKPNGLSENNPSETQHESSPEPEPYKPNELTHSNETNTSVEPTIAASVCLSMKLHGIQDINPSHQTLLALLKAGAVADEFVQAAIQSKSSGKGFSYALGIVKRQREEAAKLVLHHGAMPHAPPKTQSIHDKRSATAKAMFGDLNGNDNTRIIDVSDYSTEPNRSLISANG